MTFILIDFCLMSLLVSHSIYISLRIYLSIDFIFIYSSFESKSILHHHNFLLVALFSSRTYQFMSIERGFFWDVVNKGDQKVIYYITSLFLRYLCKEVLLVFLGVNRGDCGNFF
jgi:hypothetical protein